MRRMVLAAVLMAANGYAQRNMLEWVLPRGGSRGTTVDVTLHGQHLDNPKEVLFYDPGIKAVGFQKSNYSDVKVRFEIAPDCPVGEHVLRLRTATALSDA